MREGKMLNMRRTRYYPVDYDNKIIYDDPQPTCDPCYNRYPGIKTIGRRGRALNFYTVYEEFAIIAPPTIKREEVKA